MTRTQEIYNEIFDSALPHIKNVSTWEWWRKLRNRSVYYEAELIHNLPVSILEPEFVDHDIWFLNHQARWYYTHCNENLSSLYLLQVERIRELFSIVPEHRRAQLEWSGPP